MFVLVDDNDNIVPVTEPQIPVNLKSALVGATGWYNGAHPARLYHDVSEEAAGWAHQIDIWFDRERERFWTDCFFYSVWKDLLFVID